MKEIVELWHLLVTVFLFNFSAYMGIPAMTDVFMAALCPGRDECSLAIFLTGFNQVVTGLGTVLVTPMVGNLSDKYGRKALLTLPMAIGIIPIAILALNRSRPFFMAYYAINMFTGMFREGSIQCLSLAYVADKVCEGRRASSFGIFSGVSAAGIVLGTIAARFLSTGATFQVSAAASVIAVAYMRAFLKESVSASVAEVESTQPLCNITPDKAGSSSPKLKPLREFPSVMDMVSLLRGSLTLSQAALVIFFHSIEESGVQSALLYFLKAQFHFSKDQFANLMLIYGAAAAFSQLLLMPMLTPLIGEEKLLKLALFASCAQVLLYSISWASWVPYLVCLFVFVSIFVQPCVRSIASKKVGPEEQGMAQGCLTGISSVGSIVSPIILTPLTALFLSDNAPFNFKGFSLMCIGFASLSALIISLTMRPASSASSASFTAAKETSV